MKVLWTGKLFLQGEHIDVRAVTTSSGAFWREMSDERNATWRPLRDDLVAAVDNAIANEYLRSLAK